MTVATTLRRLADWCEAHDITTAISVALYTQRPQVHLHAPDFARVAPGAADRIFETNGSRTNQPIADVDGVTVATCIPLPAPPSASPVSPDAAEGGGL